MTKEKKQIIYDLVKAICNTTVINPAFAELPPEKRQDIPDIPDMPTEDTWYLAEELMDEVGISHSAIPFEIPLCWDNQVSIRFTLGERNDAEHIIMFCLSAGVYSNDSSKFFFLIEVENYDQFFPVNDEDDDNIYLLDDTWTIKDGKVIE